MVFDLGRIKGENNPLKLHIPSTNYLGVKEFIDSKSIQLLSELIIKQHSS